MIKKKQILCGLTLAFLLALLALPAGASARTITDSGTCGDHINWYYFADEHRLEITGYGDMKDYDGWGTPWSAYVSDIETVDIGPVLINGGITSIGEYAFDSSMPVFGLYNLKTVNISDTVTEIGEGAFWYCEALTDISLPSNLKTIGAGAFADTSLKTITIPASVTEIGENAFAGCYFSNITVASGNRYYYVNDGLLFENKNGAERLICGSAETTATSLTIPSNVSKIDRSAFSSASSIRYLTIPGAVDRFSCKLPPNIEQVTFNEGVSEVWLDLSGGESATKLSRVDFPSTLTKLGMGASWEWKKPSCNCDFYFSGNAPEEFYLTTIYEQLFGSHGSNSTLTIHYKAGTSGWDEVRQDDTSLWGEPSVAQLVAEGKIVFIESGSIPLYEITVRSGANGTAKASASLASAGVRITVTATPDEGYAVDKITYTPDGGTTKDITSSKRFEMPSSDVTINVTFKPADVAVRGITLNKNTLTLLVSSSETLRATVQPDNATNPEVTWTSSDRKVATVNSSGRVTAVSVGTATITAAAGDKKASCTVTVEPIPIVPVPASEQFSDVEQNSWYTSAVDYVVENELMQGTGQDRFEPNATLTRAMLVTILYRMEGEPAVSGSNIFDDVANGQWYTKAIIWAEKHDVVEGYGDGTFGVNDEITREQMAVIFLRYSEYKGDDVSGNADLSRYTDRGSIDDWALAGMSWAVAEGLITGRTSTTLAPDGETTRSETAVIIMRYCED